jgi:2-methylaconitate cis-trans-isomerase PrpF
MFKKNERIFEVANLMMPMMITLAIRLGMTPREFFEEVNDYTTLNKFMETLNELAKEKMERKMNGNK